MAQAIAQTSKKHKTRPIPQSSLRLMRIRGIERQIHCFSERKLHDRAEALKKDALNLYELLRGESRAQAKPVIARIKEGRPPGIPDSQLQLA